MDLINAFKKVFSSKEERKFLDLISDAHDELQAKGGNYWSLKPNEFKSYNVLASLPDKEKVGFIIYCIKEVHEYYK